MQVENVARIGFAAGRTAQDQGYFAVGHGLFGEVVIDHQGVASRVAEIFADGSAGERRVVLERRRLGGCGGHHDGVVHRPFLPEGVHDAGHGRTFLADGYIDAIDGFPRLEVRTLVDDRIDGDGSLAGLAVTDDQLALAPTDGDHRIDSLQAGLQGLVHRLAEDHAGRLAFERHLGEFADDFALSVDGLAERIDHASDHLFAHPDGGDMTGAARRHPFLHLFGGAQQHGADIVGLEVHHHGHHAAVELDQFAGLGIGQAIEPHHAVMDLQHLSDFVVFCVDVDVVQLLEQHFGDFTCFQIVNHCCGFFCFVLPIPCEWCAVVWRSRRRGACPRPGG